MKLKNTFLSLLVCLSIFLIASLSPRMSETEATCPTPRAAPSPLRKGPPRGSTVWYYKGNLDELLHDSVEEAFGIWANYMSPLPCAQLTFLEDTSDAAPNVIRITNVSDLPSGSEVAAAETTIDSFTTQGNPLGIRIFFRYPSIHISATPGTISSFASGVRKFALHEIGHILALGDNGTNPGESVMNRFSGVNDSNNLLANAPTECDMPTEALIYACPTPTPTPTPTPRPPGSCGGSPPCQLGLIDTGAGCGRSDAFISRCRNGYNASRCVCYTSPVVVDLSGNGFNLTNVAGGVNFDLDVDGTPERISWTSANSDDAWLAIDRNGDGLISNGEELFGNFTPQSTPANGNAKNGFNALAEFDKPANGGNGDTIIDSRDAVWPKLKLWQDKNHNGVSELSEVKNPSFFGVATFDLHYLKERVTDQYGNEFLYRARVLDSRGATVGEWAWDVFLLTEIQ